MLRFMSFVFFSAALGCGYWFFLRPILRQRADLKHFYDLADGFWAKVSLLLHGLKTILVARLVWVGGLSVAAHDMVAPLLAGADWQPVIPVLLARLPDEWRGIVITLAFAALGAVFEWLRRVTTGPVASA